MDETSSETAIVTTRKIDRLTLRLVTAALLPGPADQYAW